MKRSQSQNQSILSLIITIPRILKYKYVDNFIILIFLWTYWLNFNTFTAQEIFKEALYAKDLRLKILKGKPGAGLHKNNSENNQNTGESNLEIHANEVEIGEKNNKKTEMAAGTKITSAVHANNTRKIGKILKISLRKGEKNSKY